MPRYTPHSEETKRKIAEAHRGKKRPPFSDEWRKNIGISHRGLKPMLGKTHTKKAREKMSKTHKRIGSKPPSLKGVKKSDDHRRKLSEAHKGEKAYNWKGDDASYRTKHQWAARTFGVPDTCEHCGKSGLKERQIHWANKSGQYKRILDDWRRLCVSCHKKYDTHVRKRNN